MGIFSSMNVIITGKVKIDEKRIFTIKTVTYEGEIARRFGIATAIGYILMLIGFSLPAFSVFSEGTYLTLAFCCTGVSFVFFGFEILRRADKQLNNH